MSTVVGKLWERKRTHYRLDLCVLLLVYVTECTSMGRFYWRAGGSSTVLFSILCVMVVHTMMYEQQHFDQRYRRFILSKGMPSFQDHVVPQTGGTCFVHENPTNRGTVCAAALWSMTHRNLRVLGRLYVQMGVLTWLRSRIWGGRLSATTALVSAVRSTVAFTAMLSVYRAIVCASVLSTGQHSRNTSAVAMAIAAMVFCVESAARRRQLNLLLVSQFLFYALGTMGIGTRPSTARAVVALTAALHVVGPLRAAMIVVG
jgi:hypothetical protein